MVKKIQSYEARDGSIHQHRKPAFAREMACILDEFYGEITIDPPLSVHQTEDIFDTILGNPGLTSQMISLLQQHQKPDRS